MVLEFPAAGEHGSEWMGVLDERGLAGTVHTYQGDKPRIEPQDLPSYIFEDTADESGPYEFPEEQEEGGQARVPGGGLTGFKLPETGIELAGVEKSLILEALERSGGRLVGACKLLGISYKTLQYRIKKYGIDVAEIKAEPV